MGKQHDAVLAACELKAHEMGLPWEVVSPQTFAKPGSIKVNKRLWDATVFIPGGYTIWVEVKILPDDYTEGQRELLRELLAFDIPAIKVGSAEEFEELILECLYERHLTLTDVKRCQERLRTL